jgi:hypothetical protein
LKFSRDHLRFSAGLLLPVFLFYAGYTYNHAAGLEPTGFIQYDNVGYAAYARQYVQEEFHLLYANPFNDGPGYARIYFQTQNIILAGLMQMGMDPGWALCLFSVLFSFFSFYVLLLLYDALHPGAPFRTPTRVLLAWGGGLLVVAGALALPFVQNGEHILDRLFYLDPARGWWGLNFGRSLLFSLESYYHFLFFASLLLAWKGRWPAAAVVAFLLSFSHPFTGIHLLLVLSLWVFTGRLLARQHDIPAWTLAAFPLLAALHVGYYLVYLPGFPDHRLVSTQYALNWNYRWYHFGPAYAPVFALFIGSVFLQGRKAFLARPANRLLLCLAFVSLLLSNHEWFLKPMQPIHFARGYEWTAYFLMGVPALHLLFNKLRGKRWLYYAVIGLFLLDNGLWIGNNIISRADSPSTAYVTEEQRRVLQIMDAASSPQTLVIGSGDLPYLATVYTRAYPWHSHPFTTPAYARKKAAFQAFIQNGRVDSSWRGRPAILLFHRSDSAEERRSRALPFPSGQVLRTRNYKLVVTLIPR